jgi:hypothetical protein
MKELRDEAALATWEGEGGSVASDAPHRSADGLDERDDLFRIDRDLSYLGLSWLTCHATRSEQAAGDTMSDAEARCVWHPHLTVERFLFFVRMRDAFRQRQQLRQVEW